MRVINLIRHMLAQLLRVGKIRQFLMQIIQEWDINVEDNMIQVPIFFSSTTVLSSMNAI